MAAAVAVLLSCVATAQAAPASVWLGGMVLTQSSKGVAMLHYASELGTH